ncbi:hypothetical protein [Nocardioides pacificus]
MKVLDDLTGLGEGVIDANVRCGWLLRMARLTTRPGGVPRQSDMIVALADLGITTTPYTLSRMESGQLRSGRLIDAYEQVLGRPGASLRAPVDIMCRIFPTARTDRDPGIRHGELVDINAATEPLLAGRPTGADWLRWARAVSQPGVAFPHRLAVDLAGRLASELERAVGSAYAPRFEALALLRCGPLGRAVLKAAEQRLADPHLQVLYNLAVVMGQHATHESWMWGVDRLSDHRSHITYAGVWTLETISVMRDFRHEWWFDVVEPFMEACRATTHGSEHWRSLSVLFWKLPADVQRGLVRHLPWEPAAPPPVELWARNRGNVDWAACEQMSADIARQLGLDEQPLLTRLLFEFAAGPSNATVVVSYLLLSALPFSPLVIETLARAVETSTDEAFRERLTIHLMSMPQTHFPMALHHWFDGPRDLQLAAATLAASTDHPVPEGVLESLFEAGDVISRRAVFAAGLSQHPVLKQLAEGAVASPEIQGAADWWLREGGAVVDDPTAV